MISARRRWGIQVQFADSIGSPCDMVLFALFQRGSIPCLIDRIRPTQLLHGFSVYLFRHYDLAFAKIKILPYSTPPK